jgi:hypothetical protein
MAGLIDYSIIKPELANSLAAGFQQSLDRQQTQAQQQRQNALADLQLRSAQRGEEEALAEREAYKGAGNLADVQQRLMQAGLGKQSLALQKQQQEQQAARIKQAKDALDLTKTAATSIFANPDSAYAKQRVLELQKLTGQDMSGEIAQIDSFGGDPAKLKNWAAGHAMDASHLLTKFETRDVGGAVQRQGYDPLTGAPVGAAQVTQKTATPGELMADARARAQMEQSESHFKAQQANPGKEIKETEQGLFAIDKKTGVATPVTMEGKPLQAGKALTEFQGKSTGFALRAKEAHDILGSLDYSPAAVSAKQSVEGMRGVGGPLGTVANVIMSPQSQQADQAQRNFVNAVLRQESGAAISPSEFENARKQYFPQAGDSKEVVEQKRKNRETAIKSFEISAGPGIRKIESSKNPAAPAAGGAGRREIAPGVFVTERQ